MSTVAITAHGLGKKYRIAANRAQHETLRDAVVLAGKRAFRPSKRAEDYWALRDVSFSLSTGDALAQAKAVVAKLNATGGLAGRRIDLRAGRMDGARAGEHPVVCARYQLAGNLRPRNFDALMGFTLFT